MQIVDPLNGHHGSKRESSAQRAEARAEAREGERLSATCVAPRRSESRSFSADPMSSQRAGPRGYGTHPPICAELEREIQREVGSQSIAEVCVQVRRIMLMEAIRRHSGNLTRAARTLGLSRQAVQQMVASLTLRQWARQLRGRCLPCAHHEETNIRA